MPPPGKLTPLSEKGLGRFLLRNEMSYANIIDVSWWQFAVNIDTWEPVAGHERHKKSLDGRYMIDADRIDFDAARTDGQSAFICRAGRGKLIDESFDLAVDGVRDAGMLVGAYWYIYVDQGLQVQKFVEQVNAVGGVDFPICLDIERYGNEDDTAAEWQSVINANVKYLEDAGFEVMFYTSKWMWGDLTGHLAVVNGKPAGDYLLWTAHWLDVEPSDTIPFLPVPWDNVDEFGKRNWEFWQKGSSKRPHWYVDRIDWGIAHLSEDELFAKYVDYPIPPSPPSPPEDLVEQVKALQQITGILQRWQDDHDAIHNRIIDAHEA